MPCRRGAPRRRRESPSTWAYARDVCRHPAHSVSPALCVAFRRAVPMGRLGQPKDLPGAIAFLSSDAAAYITGQVLSGSGGLTMNG